MDIDLEQVQENGIFIKHDGTVDFITINGNAGKSDSQSNAPTATSIFFGSTVNSTDDYAGYAFKSVKDSVKLMFMLLR